MQLDLYIVIIYLIGTLFYGLYVGRGVKNINDYALGGSNFSTPILAATIFATYASSSAFFINVTKAYEDGFFKFLATFGQTLSLLFSGYFIGPRMWEFKDKLSVSEIFGELYGTKARIISSIPVFLVAAGLIGIQIKVLSSLLEYFFKFDQLKCVILTASIVTIYSAFGGIRSVTFTDFIQFATFGIAVPLIFIIVWNKLDMSNNAQHQAIFINHMTNLNTDKFNDYFVLLIYFLLPTLSPPIFQRMLMAKNSKQIKSSFLIATSFLFCLTFFASILGGLVYVANPDLSPANQSFPYLINNYSVIGVKGFILIGVIAMAMSTADSHLNTSSIAFSHDFCKQLGLFPNINELTISRIFSIFTGVSATILALYFQDVIKLIVFVFSFYAPTISIPMLLALFGFRTSKRALYIAMSLGVLTVLLWDPLVKFYELDNPISSFIPGIIAHMIGLFGAHYILGENGGWGSGPGTGYFNSPNYVDFDSNLNNNDFNKESTITSFLKNNIPQSTFLYNSLALYSVVVYLIAISFFKDSSKTNIVIFAFTLLFAFSLVMRNMIKDKHSYLLAPLYLITAIYSFPFASTYLVLHNSFSSHSIILLVISLLLMPFLMNWILSMVGNFIGVYLASIIFIAVNGDACFNKLCCQNVNVITLIFLLVISFKLFISKSNYMYIRDIVFNNEKLSIDVNSLTSNLKSNEENLKKLYNIKSEILNNFSHEIRTPLSIIGNSLDNGISNLDNIKIAKKEFIRAQDSFVEFKNHLLRLADLSDFQKNKILFNFKKVNFSEIINKIKNDYKNQITIFLSDSTDFEIYCDANKIESLISEIIKNSIQHASSESVDIILKFNADTIFLDIKDYAYSKYNKIKSIDKLFKTLEVYGKGENGYKGIGLTLAKEIAIAHGGSLQPKLHDDGDFGGLEMKLELPLKGLNVNQIKTDNNLSEKISRKVQSIVLVDDDQSVLDSTEMMLQTKGYKVKTISSGVAAIEYIKDNANEIDAVLLDIMMPDKSGIEVLEDVHDIIKENNIKIIIQTGVGVIEEYKEKAAEYGVSACCSKPYTIKQLIEALES